jgi:hypothetical protein
MECVIYKEAFDKVAEEAQMTQTELKTFIQYFNIDIEKPEQLTEQANKFKQITTSLNCKIREILSQNENQE